jgi:hypothetical protein
MRKGTLWIIIIALAVMAWKVDYLMCVLSSGGVEIANISPIEPLSRIFYELNCAQRMEPEVSIHVSVNGKPRIYDDKRS